jgi:hypothetical protein
MNLFTKLGRPDPTFYAGGSGVFGPEIALASFALLCGDEPGEQERDFSHVKEDIRKMWSAIAWFIPVHTSICNAIASHIFLMDVVE